MQVSVPPLVEVMRGDLVTLDCKPHVSQNRYVLEWFLVSALGWAGGREGGRVSGCTCQSRPLLLQAKRTLGDLPDCISV